MTWNELLVQICDLLQHQGRVSYRVPRRRFHLDDEFLQG
jgi:hypothetical protein